MLLWAAMWLGPQQWLPGIPFLVSIPFAIVALYLAAAHPVAFKPHSEKFMIVIRYFFINRGIEIATTRFSVLTSAPTFGQFVRDFLLRSYALPNLMGIVVVPLRIFPGVVSMAASMYSIWRYSGSQCAALINVAGTGNAASTAYLGNIATMAQYSPFAAAVPLFMVPAQSLDRPVTEIDCTIQVVQWQILACLLGFMINAAVEVWHRRTFLISNSHLLGPTGPALAQAWPLRDVQGLVACFRYFVLLVHLANVSRVLLLACTRPI